MPKFLHALFVVAPLALLVIALGLETRPRDAWELALSLANDKEW